MKKWLKHLGEAGHRRRALHCAAGLLLAGLWTSGLQAAPFDRQINFTQPDGTVIQLHGRGDEFAAVFETLDGYTVVFDPALRAYCYAQTGTDGSLVSTRNQVHLANPSALGLTPHLRMSAEARRRQVVERWQRWEAGMQIRERWTAQKAAARRFYDRSGPQFAPPPFTTTGLKVGLTLLIDFSDDPATVPQAEIVSYLNGDNYTGYGNNGSVKSYFWDNSGGRLTYTNVVTIYIRAPNPKTTYNDVAQDAGINANNLIKDALDTLKALPNYTTQILPLFNALTVDANNQVVACNVFYAGDNGGVWSMGLWPHSWALYIVGPQPLGNGMSVFRYQISNIGNELEIGTFCHENGHMLCGYPDIYDYDYDSVGGAGMFCLMNSGNYGGGGKNPVQICAYLKRASGWATITELDRNSALFATLTASAGSNFNHFYRFEKPGVPTEYYLAENRQQAGRDADIPGSGILIWHVDELGDHNDQNLTYNAIHANYEVSLVQADNQFHLQRNQNEGDPRDPFYAGNPAPGYANAFSDDTAPSARWWDGSESGLLFADFSRSGDTMTFRVGIGLAVLRIAGWEVTGGNDNGVVDANECNNLFIVLTNTTQVGASNIQVTLTTTTPGVGLGVRTANYPDIPPGAGGTNIFPFTLSTAPSFICGTPINLLVIVKSDQATVTNNLVLPTGVTDQPIRFDSVGTVFIPDANAVGAYSTIQVTNIPTALHKVAVSVHITHTWDADLTLQLISPDGTTNTLASGLGGNGDNYGLACTPDGLRTTFDDDAPEDIGNTIAPFLGTYRPQEPLAVFVGKSGTNVNGAWHLRVVDGMSGDVGRLQCWSLFLSPAVCEDGGGSCPGADLAIGMSDAPDPVFIGSNLIYTITVTNYGPGAAKSAIVDHRLPPGMIFVSALASQGSAAAAGNAVIWNIGNLPFAASASVQITVRPTLAGTWSSTASVTSLETDTDTSNNQVVVTTRVNPPTADLGVQLVDTPDPVLLRDTLTYTVIVTNYGPSIASGVTVSNTLPVSALVQGVEPSQGIASIFGNLVVISFGSLSPAASASATIRATPTAEGNLVAVARVSAFQVDPVTANNTATAATTVGPAADLAVGMSDVPDPVVVRSNLTFLVNITNLGPSSANGVVANVTLPASVNVLSNYSSQGGVTVSGTTVQATLGRLLPGNVGTVALTVRPNAIGTLGATVAVSSGEADPNLTNNTATTSTVVATPFVAIEAAGAVLTSESFLPADGAVEPDETVTVTLRLRNAGNVSNTNLVATLLPTGGVEAPSGPQTYGVLAPGGLPVSRSFTFTARGTNNGTVTATLQLADGTNALPSVAFQFTLPQVLRFQNPAAIVIPDNGTASPYPSTLEVAGITGTVGQVTVTLSNLNHTYAADVDMLLVGPRGQKVVLMSAAGGRFGVNGATVTFDDNAEQPVPAEDVIQTGAYRPASYNPAVSFPAPAPSGPYGTALSEFAGANPNGTWSLFVTDHQAGDAGNIASGWSLAFAVISPVNRLADLSLHGTASPAVVDAGETFTLRYTITNAGPDAAGGVVFTNILPAALAAVTAEPSQGQVQIQGAAVSGTLGSIPAGGSATVTLVVTALEPGAVASVASVAASEVDLNPADNTVSVPATVLAPQADLSIALAADAETLVVGSNLTFTVAVTNAGPGAALATTATNLLPDNLELVNVEMSVGSAEATNNTVLLRFGKLVAGNAARATIIARPLAAGTFTNTITVSSGSQEPAPADNEASLVFTATLPQPRIAIAAMKLTAESRAPANGMLDAGETVTLALGLRNVGEIPATNLTATLSPEGGVTSPGQAQDYGVLLPGGDPIWRSFTFTVNPTAGEPVRAQWQLAEAGGPLPPVSAVLGVSQAATFANLTPLMMPDRGIGSPYPSTITVSGLTGTVGQVTVRLNGFSHGFPDDVDVLLVGPQGQKVMLMSDAGGGLSVTNLTLTLDDTAQNTLPDGGPLSSGTFKPADYEPGDALPGPAPARPYSGQLAAFIGTDPNGVWSLYVADDTTGDIGELSGGWTLTLGVAEPVSPLANLAITAQGTPATLLAGATVTYNLQVHNQGPAAATGVTVFDTLPPGATFVSASAPQGTVTQDGPVVTFALGTLEAGAVVPLTLRARLNTVGVALNQAIVTADATDLDNTDNAAGVQTRVDVVLPARLTGGLDPTNGLFTILLSGQADETYVLQASSDLQTWVSIQTNSSYSGQIKFTDPETGNFGQRYYRAFRLVP